MIYKAIIWGCGRDYGTFSEYIYREVAANRLTIMGITSANTIYKSIDGYPFIEKSELKNIDFDFIIVAAKQEVLPDIYFEAENLGISRSKFIRADIFSLPHFTIDRYMKLRENPVTIISQICFGGLLYHRLDLPFTSPTINLWFTPLDFIKFSTSLSQYLNEKFVFSHKAYNGQQKHYYPVMNLSDISVHFNHYQTIGEATEKWYSRSKLIDYDNILVVMHADTPEEMVGFEQIPYRKVCFTKFHSETPDTVYLPIDATLTFHSEMFNSSAQGFFQTIDPLKFLLNEPGFLRCQFK